MKKYGPTTKDGPTIHKEYLFTKVMPGQILSGMYFKDKFKDVKIMSEIKKATERLDAATDELEKSIIRFNEKVKELDEQTISTSSKVRNSIAKMEEALNRVDAKVDMAKLLTATDAMEALADAIEKLASIESNGKLAKVIHAFVPEIVKR